MKVIKFAFHIRKIIEKVRKEIKFDELGMRIGIHTGKIMGGVIGTNIIRFDIYGEDAKIANKMESSGEKGKINISEDTKVLL
jgi:class 3 adenylate cyclase